LQHITAQNKGVCYKFCSNFLSEIEDQLLIGKTVFIDQGIFIGTGTLINETSEIRGADMHISD